MSNILAGYSTQNVAGLAIARTSARDLEEPWRHLKILLPWLVVSSYEDLQGGINVNFTFDLLDSSLCLVMQDLGMMPDEKFISRAPQQASSQCNARLALFDLKHRAIHVSTMRCSWFMYTVCLDWACPSLLLS